MILYECYEKVRKAQQDKPDTSKQEEKANNKGMVIHCKNEEVKEKLIKNMSKLGYECRTGQNTLEVEIIEAENALPEEQKER